MRKDIKDVYQEIESIRKKQGRLYKELELIRAKHKGILKPVFVLEYARDPKTTLHKHFTWDDTEAAEKWRLHQAEDIIRHVHVTIIHEGKKEQTRAYTSLITDRPTNTYRATCEVIADKELRKQWILTARWELEAFQKKYEKRLRVDLSGVTEAFDKATTV